MNFGAVANGVEYIIENPILYLILGGLAISFSKLDKTREGR